MAKSEKKNNAGMIIGIVIMGLALLGIVAIFAWDIVSRCNNGWTNNDTIQVVFLVAVAITGVAMIKSFQDYLIVKNKKVMFLKNDIYRLFIFMELDGSVKRYEQSLVDADNRIRLEKINKIVKRKDKTAVVTIDNLNEYFDDKLEIYKGEINIFSFMRINPLFVEIKKNKSKKYEKMYASIHSGDYIREPKFPLFEFILPLLLGIIGIFVTIYEAISVNNPINEPLIEYLKLFGATFLFALMYSIVTLRSRIEGEISDKKNTFAKLSEANAKDND